MTPTTKTRLMAAIARELVEELEKQSMKVADDLVIQMSIAIFNACIGDDDCDGVYSFLNKGKSPNE